MCMKITELLPKTAYESLRDSAFGVYHRLPLSYSTPIYTKDWDILIILDGCRVDSLMKMTDQFQFLPEQCNSVYSVASRSDMWMKRNFDNSFQSPISQTAYITGNPYTDEWVSNDQFAYVDEVWRHSWNDHHGTVLPTAMTDAAVSLLRESTAERTIIHYMQPHFPSIPDPVAEGIDIESFGSEWNSAWDLVKNGVITPERAQRAYESNLSFVLQHVEKLLRSVDGDNVVISADHANAFGEWGLYGHPINKPAPVVRRVPWVSVEAGDKGEYVPMSDSATAVDDNVKNKLRYLGYR